MYLSQFLCLHVACGVGSGKFGLNRYIVANNMIYQSMSYILTPDLHLSKLGVTPLCIVHGTRGRVGVGGGGRGGAAD